MSARVVLVHDEAEFIQNATEHLLRVGYDVVSYDDSMAALNAIEATDGVDLVITRVGMPAGTPNGISLFQVLRNTRPRLVVVFVGHPDREQFTDGIGELVPHPVDLDLLTEAVGRALEGRG